LDKPRQIGDPLSCSEAADGAHGLLTVCGIDPRAERMSCTFALLGSSILIR
jgi:hypothetical protein